MANREMKFPYSVRTPSPLGKHIASSEQDVMGEITVDAARRKLPIEARSAIELWKPSGTSRGGQRLQYARALTSLKKPV